MRFDPVLLESIRRVLSPGDIVCTLSQGRENRIEAIHDHGIDITTGHSARTSGGSATVAAWMFNKVWVHLRTDGQVEREEMDQRVAGPKVKRSSAVFAILGLRPDVYVAQERPLVLALRR